MNRLLAKLMGRYLRDEESGAGDSGGAAANTASDESDVDWGDLNEGVTPGADDVDEEGNPAPSAPTESAAPVAPVAQPPAQTPTPGQTPAESAPEGQQPVAPQTPTEQAPQQPTPEQLAEQNRKVAEDFAKWEGERVATLSKTYGFDEETAQRLQTEPELVLPQVAAKLHMEVLKEAVTIMQRMIPQMVPQVVQSQHADTQAAKDFFDANPDLKGYDQQVVLAGKMFRQMNPKATRAQAIKSIGDLVRSSLGLPALAQNPTAPTANAPAPSAPARQQPFKPAKAGGGGSGGKPAADPEKDFWAGMAADD